MPNELVVKILSNLGTRDISVCRSVNRIWKELIDNRIYRLVPSILITILRQFYTVHKKQLSDTLHPFVTG